MTFARPARPTTDAIAAAANTTDTNPAINVFPNTADAPLPIAAAIDVFPISSAAAVSHAEEPAAANSLHGDGLVKAAADVHP